MDPKITISETSPWLKVQSYEELLSATVAFLEGKLPDSPYHCGSIDDETVPLVPKLVELHKRGFLTTGSQPAEVAYNQSLLLEQVNENDGTKSECHYFQDWEQKSFVDFFVPKCRLYVNLVNYLLRHVDYVVMAERVADGKYWKNIKGRNYWLGRFRRAVTVDELSKKQWENGVCMSCAKTYGKRIFEKQMNHLIEDTLWVRVARKDYNGDVLSEILQFCKEFSIEPIYQVHPWNGESSSHLKYT